MSIMLLGGRALSPAIPADGSSRARTHDPTSQHPTSQHPNMAKTDRDGWTRL
ncbi:unnamed protein product [Ectocarpus sp. 4 AP-2014]